MPRFYGGSSIHPLISNFAAGWQLGNLMEERSSRRRGGEAMANLFTGSEAVEPAVPSYEATTVPGMGPSAQEDYFGETETEEPFGEEKTVEAVSQKPGSNPSTRDWVRFTEEALRSVQNQGPEAVTDMQDRILRMQQRHVLQNLGVAKALLEQGRDVEAGPYLERAASFMPDFTSVITSPAQMQDGSTKLGVVFHDEHTGEPKAPGMLATPKNIGQLMELYADPVNVLANNRAARIAEERLGLAQERQAHELGPAFEFEQQMAKGRLKVAQDKAAAYTQAVQQAGRPSGRRVDPDAHKKFNEAVWKEMERSFTKYKGERIRMGPKTEAAFRDRMSASFLASQDPNSDIYGASPELIANTLIRAFRGMIAKCVATGKSEQECMAE